MRNFKKLPGQGKPGTVVGESPSDNISTILNVTKGGVVAGPGLPAYEVTEDGANLKKGHKILRATRKNPSTVVRAGQP